MESRDIGCPVSGVEDQSTYTRQVSYGPVLVMKVEKEDMGMDHIITFIRQI